ncbi:hypothetical protein AC623_19135 [Bacillus sp. FJAT-27231]|uniref:vWA domain-containing protein n=1 Tax=Bacillus sp. FJAT-27231 TaxID=1679168 RepID=UPI0006716C61|nr:VWA domain-containing protein [Bacillus sp. FJAT-27231]KMY55787.1 hypothetical protein AC623_19135 [Bacillus sp. FJAT-27231]
MITGGSSVNNLSGHILSFCRYLRRKGFLVGLKEAEDGIRALHFINITDREQFRLALKTVLCSSKEEQAIFDQAFKLFFTASSRDQEKIPFLSSMQQTGREEQEDAAEEGEEQEEALRKNGASEATEGSAGHSIAAGSEEDQKKGTADKGLSKALRWLAANTTNQQAVERQVVISPTEMGKMRKAARKFVRCIQLKQSRRLTVKRKGRRFDGRRTLRASLQTGGFPVNPVWKGPKKLNAKFVLLCDGSRSMSAYADPFLQFAYALTEYTRHVEVFLFSTKLKRITPQLQKGSNGQLPVLTVFQDEWGGGTRIGESLCSFVQQYGPQMLRKETIVMIASDGLDTGSIVSLPRAMREMKQRTSAVIWLNPLLNLNGYQPEARGMKTALPYIDVFSEAQSAASFERLARMMTIRR